MSQHDNFAPANFAAACARLAPKTETAINTPPDPNELLTSKVTAALIGIKLNTLEIWRGQAKGPPFIKLSNSPQAGVRYRRADVVAWIEQRLYASTSHYTAALATLRPASSKPRDASD
jgi:hypothetical protein